MRGKERIWWEEIDKEFSVHFYNLLQFTMRVVLFYIRLDVLKCCILLLFIYSLLLYWLCNLYFHSDSVFIPPDCCLTLSHVLDICWPPYPYPAPTSPSIFTLFSLPSKYYILCTHSVYEVWGEFVYRQKFRPLFIDFCFFLNTTFLSSSHL